MLVTSIAQHPYLCYIRVFFRLCVSWMLSGWPWRLFRGWRVCWPAVSLGAKLKKTKKTSRAFSQFERITTIWSDRFLPQGSLSSKTRRCAGTAFPPTSIRRRRVNVVLLLSRAHLAIIGYHIPPTNWEDAQRMTSPNMQNGGLRKTSSHTVCIPLSVPLCTHIYIYSITTC